MTETAKDRTVKRIRAGALGGEFNHLLLIRLELPFFLLAGEAQAGRPFLRTTFRMETEFDAVSAV